MAMNPLVKINQSRTLLDLGISGKWRPFGEIKCYIGELWEHREVKK